MAEVIFDGIYKRYPNGVEAVRDFDLEIADGEFLVIVGPSGCGKSTALRMVAGLEEISGGRLFIGGQLVNDVLPRDRDVAMVFQNYALYPHMTVYNNMAFGLKMRKVHKKEIDRRVKEAAEMLDISELLDRKPKTLSGGQRQRVAMGRALVREPKVFLMDEPLSNLDTKLRAQMRAEIAKLHQRLSTTFIYVTHDQVEAMTLGSRIVVMQDGIIQQIDSPINLYNKPANIFVAGFIGSPPMNFLESCALPWLDLPEHVILGIRPENIALNPPNSANSVNAQIEHVELLGAETFLHLNLAGNVIIARAEAGIGHKMGDELTIGIDPQKIIQFDKSSGKALEIEGVRP
ncbi:MAG: sn-glycerol-3-phosphate ABC transporter ATP-binding protein UgpC [Clostridiales bacterium]|jgi:multiple sugar transport system ATP-binding protein|nr:sn-glycerol-3-phosphate ABC transporter ATP-binding protein UgpC [Clostridiales bacterium]